MPNPSRPRATTFSDDMARLRDLAANYGEGVRTGRWATPGQRSTDAGAYSPLDQLVADASAGVQAATPRFGTDWDVQGFKQNIAEGRPVLATAGLANATIGAGLDVIDPGLGHALSAAMAGLVLPAKRIAGHWDDLSKIRSPRPYETMTADIAPAAPLAHERRVITPEEMQGGVFVPAVGDRAATGGVLTGINDAPLAYGVNLEGGPNYMRTGHGTWASEKAQTTGLANRIARAQETGRPVFTVYTSQAARSGDFGHHNADALLAQVPGAKMTSTNMGDFDAQMREQFPQWAGLRNTEKLHDQLYEPGAGGMRLAFVQEADKERWQKKGMPSVASTRFATTEPELRGQPTGVSGLTISRFDQPPAVSVEPRTHSTYPATLQGGEYVGGFSAPIPRDLMWRDWANQRSLLGKSLTDSTADRGMQMFSGTQIGDQKWVDDLSAYLNTINGVQ